MYAPFQKKTMDLFTKKKKKESGTHIEHSAAQTHLIELGGSRAEPCFTAQIDVFYLQSPSFM